MSTKRERPGKQRRNLLFPNRVRALHLFIAGGLVIPAFLFQPSLVVRAGQVLSFAVLARLAGKKIKWLYFVIMVGSITFFNLITPMGEVLFNVGPFVVTGGALRSGLLKGITIVGLVFISLFSIRPDLKLPGRLGGLIGRVFYYFEHIIEGKRRIEARRLIGSIDDVLESLFLPGTQATAGTGQSTTRTDRIGALFLCALVSVHWALLVTVTLL